MKAIQGLLLPSLLICATATAMPRPARPPTERLISYLEQLASRSILERHQLERLRASLSTSEPKLANPISRKEAKARGAAWTQREGLQQLLEQPELDRARVLAWLESHLVEKETERSERSSTAHATQVVASRMGFHTIPAGEFDREFRTGYVNDVTRTQVSAFDLLSTHVTQWQWETIMGENPSRFPLSPDHPIESVRWEDVQEFIRKLNERSAQGDPAVAAMIPGHRVGDRYRLPTDQEWEYVRRAFGPIVSGIPFGIKSRKHNDLHEYAWFNANSQGSTHSAGEKKAIRIAGQDFYDLVGNVREWVWDPTRPDERFVRGSSWMSAEIAMSVDHRASQKPESWQTPKDTWKSEETGFRLVRERANAPEPARAPSSTAVSKTDHLIQYLTRLTDQSRLSSTQLARLRESLARGDRKLANPYSRKEAKALSAIRIQREGIENLLSSDLDRARLLEWLDGAVRARESETAHREEAQEETRHTYRKGEFLPIDSEGKVELGMTPVTQWQWSMIMGFNPSAFVEGPMTKNIPTWNGPVRAQPDHPVENVSWIDVKGFEIRLIKLSRADDPLLKIVFPDHGPGDRYRIPSRKELDSVRFAESKSPATWDQLAWTSENSGGSTQPVAFSLPFTTAFGDFYDLMGNVGEWVDGQNVVGAGWSDPRSAATSATRRPDPNLRKSIFGVRLARERGTLELSPPGN